MPVRVSSVYNTNIINDSKVAGDDSCPVIDAGIFLHSGGAGAVPVMDFEE